MLRNKAWLIKRYAPTLPNLPAPTAPHDAEPTNCIKINEQWIPLILGALHIFLHEDLFAGDEAARRFVADEAQNLLIAVAHGNTICLGDGMYLLRQSETDACVLEQSTDGGLTWTIAFDYGRCISKNSTADNIVIYNELNAYNSALSIVQNTWGGDIINIAPDMVYDGGQNDEKRDNAACVGLSILIAQMAANVEKSTKTGEKLDNIIEAVAILSGAGLAVVSILTPLAAVTIPAYIVAGLEIAATTASVAAVLREILGREPDFVSVLDEEVQLDLLCCAYGALSGGTPDIVTFSQMFDNCDPVGSDDDLLPAMQQIVRSESVYIAFISTMQSIYETLDAGAEINCICDEQWTAIVPLDVPTLPPVVEVIYGTHQANVGVNGVNFDAGGIQHKGVTARITTSVPFNLLTCRTKINMSKCGGLGIAVSAGGIATTNKVENYQFEDILNGQGVWIDGPANDQTVQVHHNIYSCRFNYGGNTTLLQFAITGRGDVPVELQAYIV